MSQQPPSETSGSESWRPKRETKKQREWVPGQEKPLRSIRTMFASSVLVFEAFVFFFGGLTVYKLQPDAWWNTWFLVVYIALALACVVLCALLSKPWGYWAGWVIQFLMIVGGFFEPWLFIVGPMFAFTWGYAVVKGKKMDEENVRRRAAEQEYWAEQEAESDNSPHTER